MSNYIEIQETLLSSKHKWLITGVAGFIGSNLLEKLLQLNQSVVGLDNFSTGHHHNLDEVKRTVSEEQWNNFKFIEGDITNIDDCNKAVLKIDYVLHQAALGSVPRSIANPIATNNANINGFINILNSSKDANVKRFVFAASSSTYGDHPALPKKEDIIGKPLSPYAITKLVNEMYADMFYTCYGLEYVGLRYFNVFGKRQDPNGAYAAVIPKWINQILNNLDIEIYGDGKTSRDFTYVDNVVQMNILAATTSNSTAVNQIYNTAVGEQNSLNELFNEINKNLMEYNKISKNSRLTYKDFRKGDVKHSLADISKAQNLLSYNPTDRFREGIKKTCQFMIDPIK